MRDTFTFHTDPGHGWLEVTYAELVDLGLQHRISRCSYFAESRPGADETCYLEEDCDASLFIFEYQKRFGKFPIFEERFYTSQSRIRRFLHYPQSPGYSYEANARYMDGGKD